MSGGRARGCNPWRFGKPDGQGGVYTRDRIIDLYRRAARFWVDDPDWLAPLRGHDLVCWCPLDQPCHADVLLELADG